jgi:hypothetical protein
MLWLRKGKRETTGKRTSETREVTTAVNALPTLESSCEK